MSKPMHKEMTMVQKKDIMTRYLLYNATIKHLYDDYRVELNCSISWFNTRMSSMIGDTELIGKVFKNMRKEKYFKLRFDKCLGSKTDPIWGDMTEDELMCYADTFPMVDYKSLSIDEKLIYYRDGAEI